MMNKKLFLGMFAAAGMLLATSCSNDELNTVQTTDEALVSFSLGLEGGIATKAISDGKSADVLVYAVFDKDGNRLSNIKAVTKEGVTFPTTENISLAKGQTYKVAFWAQDADCKAYTVNTDNMTVAVDYANDENKVNNDETRDAFFKTVEFTVNGNQTIDIELKRPFAQINVGVYKKDWEAAVASGIEIEKSSVIIKNAATSMNLLTGEVGDETADVEVSYASGTIPDEDLKVDLNGDKDFEDENEVYKWLSMSYILVADRNADTDNSGVLGDERATLESLQYTFAPKSGNNITFGDGLNSVPVQRNWRTNILGQILTGDIQFNITINPIFDGDINVDAPISEVKSDAQTLAEALTANEEEILVVLGADIDLPISSLGNQTAGSGEYKLGGADTKNITIDLNGKTLNLTTGYMSAIGAKNADATITIKNGTMTSTGNKATTWNINDVIFANCNYVIENVTFEKEVALTNAGKSVTMNNVTINGTGNYYALWISAKGQTIEIDNLTVNTPGRGIKIDDQYVDAPAKVTLNIDNSAFTTANKAAVMVKSIEGAIVNWGEDNDISNVAADTKFAVWVDEDSKDYADKVVVNGAYVKVEGTFDAVATTAEEITLAAENATADATIYLADDITGNATIAEKNNVKITIVGNNHNYNGTITVNGKSSRNENAGLTISGINFNAESISADAYINLGGNNSIRYTDNVTVKDCTFSGTDVVAVKSYTGGDHNLSITGCTVNDGMHSMLQVTNIEEGLNITDCKVYSKNGINLNNTPSLEMSGCTFDTKGYAIRFGVSGSVNSGEKTFTVSNSSLKSACDDDDAVIMFRDNATYATLTLTNTTVSGSIKVSGNTEKTTINGLE